MAVHRGDAGSRARHGYHVGITGCHGFNGAAGPRRPYPLGSESPEFPVNIVHAAAYGITIWLSILLFILAAGESAMPFVWWGPVIVSVAAAFLLTLDWAIWRFLEAP